MNIGLEKFYSVSRGTVRSISSPTVYEDLLVGMGISQVHFLAIRVQAGILELRVSSDLDVDQVFPVSDFIILANPVNLTHLTALAARGSADFEIIIAGTP